MNLIYIYIYRAQRRLFGLGKALGRCIRHRGDFGAIVLLDPRFNDQVSVRRGEQNDLRAVISTPPPHSSSNRFKIVQVLCLPELES